MVVGAVGVQRNSRRLRLPDTPAGRAAQLARADDDDDGEPGRRSRRVSCCAHRAWACCCSDSLVGACRRLVHLVAEQYFVATTTGTTGEVVAIFRGPTEPLFGVDLSRLVETSTVGGRRACRSSSRSRWPGRSWPSNLEDARDIVQRLADEAQRCAGDEPAGRLPGDAVSAATAPARRP